VDVKDEKLVETPAADGDLENDKAAGFTLDERKTMDTVSDDVPKTEQITKDKVIVTSKTLEVCAETHGNFNIINAEETIDDATGLSIVKIVFQDVLWWIDTRTPISNDDDVTVGMDSDRSELKSTLVITKKKAFAPKKKAELNFFVKPLVFGLRINNAITCDKGGYRYYQDLLYVGYTETGDFSKVRDHWRSLPVDLIFTILPSEGNQTRAVHALRSLLGLPMRLDHHIRADPNPSDYVLSDSELVSTLCRRELFDSRLDTVVTFFDGKRFDVITGVTVRSSTGRGTALTHTYAIRRWVD